jgi:hypothetical protein
LQFSKSQTKNFVTDIFYYANEISSTAVGRLKISRNRPGFRLSKAAAKTTEAERQTPRQANNHGLFENISLVKFKRTYYDDL